MAPLTELDRWYTDDPYGSIETGDEMISVYSITNEVNGKMYVGQTKSSVATRWSQHKSASRKGIETYFLRALRKHGPEVFTVRVTEEVQTKNEADDAERFYILLWQTHLPDLGYNCTLGGEGGARTEIAKDLMRARNTQRGKPLSEDVKKKISDRLKGRVFSEEHRANIRRGLAACTRVYSEKTRQANIGRKASPETRLKMSLAHSGSKNHFFGKHHTEESKEKRRRTLENQKDQPK